MLPLGSPAPDFTLRDDAGRDVSLRDLRASGRVVLLFYPADFTPVCTKEACMVRDLSAELRGAGITVVAISPQSEQSKARFRAANNLTHVLLADPGRAVAKAYGADKLFGVFPLGVSRVTYLISPEGIIEDAVRSEFALGAHEALLARAVARSRPQTPPPAGVR